MRATLLARVLWASMWMLFVACAHAVEFGESTVHSFIGQPLVAEVELTALTPEESGALQVRQAGMDVYRGANIRFDPALHTLYWVIQHRDKRQFIRLMTKRPILTPYLNLFFELGTRNERNVRALTVWLDAPPQVAQDETASELAMEPPAPAPEPESAPVSAPVPDAPPDAPAPAVPATGICGKAHQRCAATERENRIISAHIRELEKNVKALRSQLVKPAPPKAPSVKAAEASVPEPEHEPVAEGELFLKKEEPYVPKKVLPKPVFWTRTNMFIAGFAAVLIPILIAWAVMLRKKKAAGKRVLPVKPATTGSWFVRLRQRFGKPKAAPVAEADDANLMPEQDATPEADGEAGQPAVKPSAGRMAGLFAAVRGWPKGLMARFRKKPVVAAEPVEG